jgi:hypothetical protein
MLIFWATIAGVAAVLAVVVSALIIGTCLALAWITDTIGAGSRRGQRGSGQRTGGQHGSGRHGSGQRGEGRPGGYDPPYAGGGHRNGPGVPAAPRRGYR